MTIYLGFMHGKNPIRPPVQGDGSMLEVQHIFPTLQGEGPYAGVSAVFVRLGGCNLACEFCDTEFESYKPMALNTIIERVSELAGKARLVVITGGEPLRQPIAALCAALIKGGFTVQVETNGTIYRELPPGVELVCSPKNTGKGYFPIRPDLLARINAFKFIISDSLPGYGDIADVGQGSIPVYVQPMDEYDEAKNKANLARATSIAMQKGCRLSIQLHKIAGIE